MSDNDLFSRPVYSPFRRGTCYPVVQWQVGFDRGSMLPVFVLERLPSASLDLPVIMLVYIPHLADCSSALRPRSFRELDRACFVFLISSLWDV